MELAGRGDGSRGRRGGRDNKGILCLVVKLSKRKEMKQKTSSISVDWEKMTLSRNWIEMFLYVKSPEKGVIIWGICI